MVNKNFDIRLCCDDMLVHLYLLDQKSTLDNGDVQNKTIHYSSKFNEFGIPLIDKISFISINYCPWCGSKLPESFRKQWFEELNKLGFEAPLVEDDYPKKYKSWEWWKNKFRTSNT